MKTFKEYINEGTSSDLTSALMRNIRYAAGKPSGNNVVSSPKENNPSETRELHLNTAPANYSAMSDDEVATLSRHVKNLDKSRDNTTRHLEDEQSTSGTKQTRHDINTIDNVLGKHKTKADMSMYVPLKKSPSSDFMSVSDKNGNVPAAIEKHYDDYVHGTTSLSDASATATSGNNTDDRYLGLPRNKNHTHVMKLHVPKGTHAMSTIGFFGDTTNRGVMLHRGHSIVMNAKPEIAANGVHVWHAKVVSRSV